MHIVILGAGYGGMLATLRLAKYQPQAQITLVNARTFFVERVRNHELASGQEPKQRPIADLLQGMPVNFVHGQVVALDANQQRVEIQTDDGHMHLNYDRLVYALGSVVDRDAVPGIRENAYTLDFASATALSNRLPAIAQRSGRLIVIGGGLTGIEAVTEFAEQYPNLKVELITRGQLGQAYPQKARDHLNLVFQRLGITLHENTTVQAIETGQVVTDCGSFVFDVCVWAGGFRGLPLAREAGLIVNGRDQMLIDAQLRSISHPTIYGVGDAADFTPATGINVRMACATACPMGAQAADNVLASLRGKPEQAHNFGYLLHCISLGRKDGLIQFVHAGDSPRSRFLTGHPAAIVKERVVRFAWWGVAVQRDRPKLYIWPKAAKSDTVGAAETARQQTTS